MKNCEELTGLFRERGLKVTPQRQAIFDALCDNTSHPTAEAIHATVTAAMPTISLRTVYQTLHDLVDMGEVAHVDVGTGSARFDPNLEPHHHLVCDGCATIVDVGINGQGPSPIGCDPEFVVTSTDIIFRGLCTHCQAQGLTGKTGRVRTADS